MLSGESYRWAPQENTSSSNSLGTGNLRAICEEGLDLSPRWSAPTTDVTQTGQAGILIPGSSSGAALRWPSACTDTTGACMQMMYREDVSKLLADLARVSRSERMPPGVRYNLPI